MPGKDFSFSATTNYRGSDLLYVFSTNAHPFDHETSYSKFAAFALLKPRRRLQICGSSDRTAVRDEGRTPAADGRTTDEDRAAIQDDGAQPIPPQKAEFVESYIDFAPQFLAVEDPPILI